jgi:hypothetical protein
MKRLIITTTFIFFVFSANYLAQNQPENVKKTTYGFGASINYSNLAVQSNQGFENDLKNNLGFEVGLLMERRLSAVAFLSPRINLSFNNIRFNEIDGQGNENQFKVMPMRLDFMMYAIFRDQKQKLQPYFFFGPSIKTPLDKSPIGMKQYSLVTDIGLDLGIGLNKVLPNFQFAPELKYSFGLMNLTRSEGVNKMNLHMLSLVFNIKSN